jgi:NADPH:quinone reductase-like Zn-dependent oxidoreductase
MRGAQRQRPPCEDHEVVIKVKACALSALDVKVPGPAALVSRSLRQSPPRCVACTQIRKGEFKRFVTLPASPGFEVSGVVEQKGAQVKQLNVGDEVVGAEPARANARVAASLAIRAPRAALSPIDNVYGGCAEYTVQSAVNVGLFVVPHPTA